MISGNRGCRLQKMVISLIFLCIIIVFFPLKTDAEPEPVTVELLVAKAMEKKLSEDTYWHILLHYKRGFLGLRSLIDDPRFFLAEDGKDNPAAELVATIRYLFDPAAENREKRVSRFIARYHWLREQLISEEISLPLYECTTFNEIIARVKPTSVTLVYPSGYLNSPASMYGHTFLIVESESQSKLLAHAVNYSAMTNETFGPIFALRGLFGGYKGYFSSLPYYEKVAEYSDFEKRDIWEYSLNLNHEEIVRMIRHLVELNNIYSDYYFFDENCSYNLLFFLEAARPSVTLTDKFFMTATPVDTIREVKKNNMCASVTYRASNTTKIYHIASKLSRENQYLAIDIAEGEKTAAALQQFEGSEEEKSILCELTTEYLRYKRSKKEISRKEYSKRLLQVLKIRSELKTERSDQDIPRPVQPEYGHASNRISIGVGYRESDVFQQIMYRPTYHGFIDPDEGYISGSEIVFGDLGVRYYYKEKLFKVQKFDVIDVVSVSATDKFFLQGAWKVKTGLRQKLASDNEEHLAAYVNSGGGMAFDVTFPGRIYFFAEADVNANKYFEDNLYAGAGGSIGVINYIGNFWKYHLYSRGIYYVTGETHTLLEAVAQNMLKCSRNANIVLEYAYCRSFDVAWHEYLVHCNFYF